MIITLLFSLITGFLLVYFATPPIVKVSIAKRLFDVPNARKLNQKVVPTLGGIAIFLGLILSTIICMKGDAGPDMRMLFAAVIMMMFIGLKDDLLAISARKKLAVQLAAALLLVLVGHFRITDFYGLGTIGQIPLWAGIPISVIFILFLVNAFNLIDGIDGLAAGLSLLISMALGAWFFLNGHFNYAVACLSLSGSLLAFLRFNLWGGRLKIFMGDTGSLILGVFMAAIVLKFMELNLGVTGPLHMAQAPLVALALVIVPVTDTLRVFAVRIWHRRSPFAPDMNHIHHLLIKSGMGHIQASAFLVIYTVIFTLLALSMQQYLNMTLGFAALLGLSFLSAGLIYQNSKRMAGRKTEAGVQHGRTRTVKLEAWVHPDKTTPDKTEGKTVRKLS